MNKIKKLGLCTMMLLVGGIATASPAKAILDSIQSRYVPDRRVAVWDISLQEATRNGVPCQILLGKTDNKEAKQQLLNSLKRNNISYEDFIELLPNVAEKQQWALVRISVACIRSEARSGAELASQAIMGTPLRVLEQRGGMSRVQTPDGYIGYVTDNSLSFLSASDMAVWKEAERYIVTASQTKLYSNPKADDDNIVTDLVLGNIIEYKGKTGKFIRLALPDGRTGFALKKEVQKLSKWTKQTFNYELIEKNARRMMGSPYLWGGMSTKMADCSGFVKTCYFANGIILQRDASQQAHTGQVFKWEDWKNDMMPGDLIFIGTKSGRVTHVAMYIGNGKYIHSSGRVKINSLDPASPDYLDYTFLSVSRIKGHIGTQGITAVKAHPWYFNL